jgi:hypothetical protein
MEENSESLGKKPQRTAFLAFAAIVLALTVWAAGADSSGGMAALVALAVVALTFRNEQRSTFTATTLSLAHGQLVCLRLLFKAGADLTTGSPSTFESAAGPDAPHYSPACSTFVKPARPATTVLHELEDLIKAERVDEACALISEPANVKLRVAKSKKTDFAFLFDKVLDVIEANNKLKAEGFMNELVLEQEQAKKDKQARRDAKTTSKSSSKGKKTDEAATTAPPASAAAALLEQQDMQVMTTLSGLLEQDSAEWSSTPPARLRQMLKDAGGDIAGVSEKRMKKIKAWALASPVAGVALVDGSASLPPCCALCGKTKSELAAGEKLRSCSGCGTARYCSGECQKTAWPGHKKECSGRLIQTNREET